MDLRHLRHFVAVAEELHFARAAERAGIEQSPLSRSIRNLEARLNAQLFDRTTRTIRLTAAGEKLLCHARALLAAADEAQVDVRTADRADSNGAGHLHIGFCDGVPLPRLARLIAALRQESPHLDLHVHEVPMMRKLYELRSGLLDAAITPESGYGKGIVSEAIWQDRPIAVFPCNHALAAKDRLVLADIISEPLVLCRPDTGLGHQCQIEQIVRTATATPNIVNRATSLCMLVMLVFAGDGIGIATAAQLEAVGSADLVLRPLCDAPCEVKTWLMKRDEEPAESLARFVEQARRIA